MSSATKAVAVVHQGATYTPFSYFFEVGIGIALGMAIIIMPCIWLYKRYLKG